MTDAELTLLAIKCWNHNKITRKKSFEKFLSIKKNLNNPREKMFKLIKKNLNELSEEEKNSAREIANIVMARISDLYAITSSERGFGDKDFYGYIEEINKIYDYDHEWTDSFNIEEVQDCVEILKEVGDIDSLKLIIYGLDFIFENIFEGSNLSDFKSTTLVENAISGIGKRIGVKKAYQCVADMLSSVLLGWLDYGMPAGIYLKGKCLKYSKHYLEWLSTKLRELGQNPYSVNEGLKIIPTLEERLNAGIMI